MTIVVIVVLAIILIAWIARAMSRRDVGGRRCPHCGYADNDPTSVVCERCGQDRTKPPDASDRWRRPARFRRRR